MQVQDYRKIKPTLLGPNIADVTGPFLIWRVGGEVTIQQVWRNVELVIAVCGDLVFTGSDDGYTILAHQSANPAMSDVQADFLQLFRHPWPAVATQAETRLFFDMCQRDEIGSLSAACGAASESTQTACADTDNIAKSAGRKVGPMFSPSHRNYVSISGSG
jgi:hypothetical protein